MALQGTIETFALPDVLRLLANSTKTGKLAVTGDRGLGALWVADGELVASEIDLGVHPSTGSTDVAEGLFQLLRFETGEFVFTADGDSDEASAPEGSNERHDIESSISASSSMLDELNEITENVPGITSHVSFRPEIETNEVTFTAEQWRVLSAVGGGATVADLASNFSFGELEAMRRVDDLVSEGVIDVSDEAPASEEPAAVETPVEQELVDEEPVDQEMFAAAPEEETAEETVAEAADSEAFDATTFDDPAFDEVAFHTSEEDAGASADPFAASVADEVDDPFAAPAVAEESYDPFAAPIATEQAEDPFAVAEVAADDPFAPNSDADQSTSAELADEPVGADPFAPSEPAVSETPLSDDPVDIDPFAPAATEPEGDLFAPTGAAVAGGATGGVLHDVFGNNEHEADATWEPAVGEVVDTAPSEWPAPNAAAVADADAPWSSGEAESQLPPPPAPDGFASASDGFAPANESASQLPPPPAMADGAPSLDGFAEPVGSIDPLDDSPATDMFASAPDETGIDAVSAESELPPPPAMGAPSGAPESEVDGVPSFPEAPPAFPEAPSSAQSAISESNDMARQLASLSPSAARAVANAAKAETPEARDAALAEAEAEDASVDRSLLLRFLGKNDKKES